MQRGGAWEGSPAQAVGMPVAEALVEIIWTLELEIVGNQLHLALNPGNQGNDRCSHRHRNGVGGTSSTGQGTAVLLSVVKVYSWLLSPHPLGHLTM